jgi:hypothetical protein
MTRLTFSCPRCGLVDVPVRPALVDEGMTLDHYVDRTRRLVRHYHAVMDLMCAGEPLELTFHLILSLADHARFTPEDQALLTEQGALDT